MNGGAKSLTDTQRRKRPRREKKEQDNSQVALSTVSWKRWTLCQVHDSPHIYVIDDFLSEIELQHLNDSIIAKSRFVRSFVDREDNLSSEVSQEQRTSTFVSLPKQGNSKIAAIERRAADMLGIAADQIEPLQLVRYRQDQFFGVHHDLGSLLDDGTVELPPKQAFCKRRLATFFCYLNDVETGCTYFPECSDLRVTPTRGRAVLFCNILREGLPDPKTVHAGEPVRGNGNVKYGLNIWACEN